jgi:O-antigen/teichoic acid export membrane protein
MSVKKNVIANYFGQGWSAVMALAFLPLYIEYLGIESYGIIGVYVIIQSALGLLDIGMTPTLNREMARFSAGAHTPKSIRNLLRTLEFICFSIALLGGIVIWMLSDYLAASWLIVKEVPVSIVAEAIAIIALVVSLRFCEGIYRGSLYGLNKQVWYNCVNAFITTLRYGGAVLVLAFYSPSIIAFFVWQALVSILAVVVFAFKVHRALPTSPSRTTFSISALQEIRHFATGMLIITLLSMALTQAVPLLLSHLLTLENFGYYSFAVVIASAITTMFLPVVQAVYPRMVEQITTDNLKGLIKTYHQSAQLITVITVPAALLVSVFSYEVVYAWSGDLELAKNTAPILSIYAIGTLLNGFMTLPYYLQIASGWTSLGIKTNIVAIFFVVPAVFLVVPHYGGVGGAWIWLALNIGYVLFAIPFMHKRLIKKEMGIWYFKDLLLPISGAFFVVLIAKFVPIYKTQSRVILIAFFVFVGLLSVVASSVLAGKIREQIFVYIRQYFVSKPPNT